ncbi:alpha/beta-hydrolase [Lojkania enalia]|uniref:Alpha/beta-hydrolase n=1 Tax=Lojkania enalia TaxID=147567 RepID=A0A9P4NAL0_9PLEO|nr:alpha/beta-hydrolase [Didymosphaeria enalia]
MALLATQPFKTAYALGAFAFELARLPFWFLKYLHSYGRQHPEWSFGQALRVRVFFSVVYHIATIHIKTPLPLTPDTEKERFIVIDSAPIDSYQGPVRGNEDVKPAKIGGTWYPAPLTISSDLSTVTVILHIHGGAFVTGDGRTAASGYFAKKLLMHTGATHVFVPQYRLSTLPVSKGSNPFPAALQDTLTSYLYLLNTLKISPSNIILSGDSAGANLAISLLRYIVEYGTDLNIPNPSAALLWSPWINPADTSDEYTRTNPNYNTDYLSYPFTKWGADAYAGLAGTSALSSPYVSHKKRAFKTEVPIFVNTASAELLYFDDVEWVDTMKEAGNNVTLDIAPNAPHDILLMGKALGFDKEAARAAERAGEWLKSVRK